VRLEELTKNQANCPIDQVHGLLNAGNSDAKRPGSVERMKTQRKARKTVP
jgi:hypothetical protein